MGCLAFAIRKRLTWSYTGCFLLLVVRWPVLFCTHNSCVKRFEVCMWNRYATILSYRCLLDYMDFMAHIAAFYTTYADPIVHLEACDGLAHHTIRLTSSYIDYKDANRGTFWTQKRSPWKFVPERVGPIRWTKADPMKDGLGGFIEYRAMVEWRLE